MYKLLIIALGGALGTLARYGTSTLLQDWSARFRFPYGTMAVNLVGCFMIGLLQGLFANHLLRHPEYKTALLVGFLGGYTTFSTYAWESTAYLQDGQYVRAGMNMLVQNVVGIALVMLGYFIGVRS